MRSTIGFAIAALVLGLFGVAFLGVARLEGYMADAGGRLSTLQSRRRRRAWPRRSTRIARVSCRG